LFFFTLVEALNSSTHYVMRFVFDFSMDSWLTFQFGSLFVSYLFLLFLLFLLVYFVRYVLARGAILFLRSVFMVFSLSFFNRDRS
jgi:hypothetical protein